MKWEEAMERAKIMWPYPNEREQKERAMNEIKDSDELNKELHEQRQIAQEAFNYAVYNSGKIRKAKNLAITAIVIGIASICLDVATIAFMH